MRDNKLRDVTWLAVGVGIAIAILLLLVPERSSPLILAPLAGSAIYLFALTDADESQPRALFGGHLISTAIGLICFRIFGDALWVSAVAVVAAMTFMTITRTIHPPAGADPLVLMHDHAGLSLLLNPVATGVVVLFLLTMGWSRLRPGTRYPAKWWLF